MGLKHFFHSTKADPSDPTIIGATKWNDDHYYVDGAGAPVGNVGALLLAGAAGALTHLNSVAAGSVLTSAGVGALPVWAPAAGGVPAALVADSVTFSVANPDVMLSRGGAGNLLLTGGAIPLLQFGGTTAAFPALRRNGAALNLILADSSLDADFSCRSITLAGQVAFGAGAYVRAGTGSPEGVVGLPVGSLWLRTDGGASTTLYVKQTGGGGATGWVAK
jgi:hypothetical protein